MILSVRCFLMLIEKIGHFQNECMRLRILFLVHFLGINANIDGSKPVEHRQALVFFETK